jgi:hypothetical protein
MKKNGGTFMELWRRVHKIKTDGSWNYDGGLMKL